MNLCRSALDVLRFIFFEERSLLHYLLFDLLFPNRTSNLVFSFKFIDFSWKRAELEPKLDQIKIFFIISRRKKENKKMQWRAKKRERKDEERKREREREMP